MARLERVWKSDISFATKFRLYKSLVLSVLLYGCESWTLLAETEMKIQAFEYKCLQKLPFNFSNRANLLYQPFVKLQ